MSQALKLPDSAVATSAGLDVGLLATLLETADFVVFHAALYSNFVDSDISKALIKRLTDTEAPLDCWLIEAAADTSWGDEFAAMLRPALGKDDMTALYQRSFDWCRSLKQRFGKDVQHVSSQSLALTPLIIIDDTLFAGQYLHSAIPAADGLWIKLDARALGLAPGSLKRWFYPSSQGETQNEPTAPLALALKRMVDECALAARDGARTMYARDMSTRTMSTRDVAAGENTAPREGAAS
ncbi:hypothetical protein KJI95_09920 [Shewanella sp. JM162201]|uniref:FCP1 homology domain-containing protein n=1 Tax=Shewanella jiangmenensis TaxID=2837387 RepID=A0ABS5V733_9GAMM|nr:hypothetical protein [Shewanella jiangmenensis]MBT1444838.1 hypothetical protein [Shewanella jiangmenensis]